MPAAYVDSLKGGDYCYITDTNIQSPASSVHTSAPLPGGGQGHKRRASSGNLQLIQARPLSPPCGDFSLGSIVGGVVVVVVVIVVVVLMVVVIDVDYSVVVVIAVAVVVWLSLLFLSVFLLSLLLLLCCSRVPSC